MNAKTIAIAGIFAGVFLYAAAAHWAVEQVRRVRFYRGDIPRDGEPLTPAEQDGLDHIAVTEALRRVRTASRKEGKP